MSGAAKASIPNGANLTGDGHRTVQSGAPLEVWGCGSMGGTFVVSFVANFVELNTWFKIRIKIKIKIKIRIKIRT